MKKIIAIFLLFTISFSCWACNAKNEETAKSAFENIHKSHEKLIPIGEDVISAWTLGINNEGTLTKYLEGFSLFCSSVSLTRDEVLDGLASLEYQASGICDLQYYTESVREYYDLYFDHLMSRYDSAFSACVFLVIESYKIKGNLVEIESWLSSAKESIKELGEKDPNSAYYADLKEYFAAINAYYNLCIDPSGTTLVQAEEDIHDYNKTADACYNSLYYFFE